MKKFTFLISIASLTVLTGCSKSGKNELTNVNGGEIRAVARALSIDASTRAAYTADHAKGLQAFVLTSQDDGDYTTAYASGTMTFDASDAENTAVGYETFGFTGNTKLPADKSSLYMSALYPASAWSDITTTASFTFNGTQDVMAAPQSTIAKGGTETAAFAFTHLLTKIDITVKADDADAIDAWGDVKKIEITKVSDAASFNDKIAVTLSNGTAVTGLAFSQGSTGKPTSWKTYKTDDSEFTAQSVALTETASPVATTIMAPFTATNAATDLEVAVTTQTAAGSELVTKVAVTVPAGDTQGQQYNVNLNFKAKDIKGTATVATWGRAVDIDQDVE